MYLETSPRIGKVRTFNRFYTSVIGALRGGLLDTPYSLTEARVIFELAQRDASDVAHLRRALDIDAGYLSRILARFESDGLVARARSTADGRRRVITLTERGGSIFALLDERSAQEIDHLLSGLKDDDQRRLVEAMNLIRALLEGSTATPAIVIRQPGPGDFGWVVQRHGALYAREYGWDETFESLVARIVADYIERRDPLRDSAWIAEVDGEPVGCVFCVNQDTAIAQLRLLLVEPSARGLGIGSRLVEECVRFARNRGYERMTLWTNDVLVEARRLYERAGFHLVDEDAHHSFGNDLVGQTWELDLSTTS